LRRESGEEKLSTWTQSLLRQFAHKPRIFILARSTSRPQTRGKITFLEEGSHVRSGIGVVDTDTTRIFHDLAYAYDMAHNDGGRINGAAVGDTIYLFRDGLENLAGLKETIWHELLHY
jgi:hypothetical protein